MLWVNNISVKTSLLATMLVLGGMLIVNLLYTIFIIYQPQLLRGNGLHKANQLADYIISASAEEAKERGFTATYITNNASGVSPDSSLKANIDQYRKEGDKHITLAFKIARELTSENWAGVEFKNSLKAAETQWQKIQTIRQSIDNNSANSSITSSEWVRQMSQLIDDIFILRQMAFNPASHLEGAIYNNIIIKQAVWSISEYSGRERAIVASAIAAEKPIDRKQLEILGRYRGVVEFNLGYLENLAMSLITNKKHQMFAADIKNNWQKIQTDFLGSYQKLREQVYLASSSGQYPVSADEWLTQASSAINTIVNFNHQVSLDAARHSKEYASEAQSNFWRSSAFATIAIVTIIIGLLIVNNILRRILALQETFVKVADNKDITLRVDDSGTNEISILSGAFNSLIQDLEDMIAKITNASGKVSIDVDKSVNSCRSNSQGISQQEGDIEQLASAMTEMVASIQSIGDSSQINAKGSSKVNNEIKQSGQTMRDTASSIRDLGTMIEDSSEVISQLATDSSNIGQVLEVIKGIAEQTNLLALNAAIEAARAGEQGRGFAVVADEVRTLAGRTHESTEEIQQMIERLQAQSKKATQAMQSSLLQSQSAIEKVTSADETLNNVIISMSEIMEMNSHIAVATEEQSSVAEEINQNVSSLQTVAESNHQLARDSVDNMGHISNEMKTLVEIVRQYRS